MLAVRFVGDISIKKKKKKGTSIEYGGVSGYFQTPGFKMETRMCSVSLNSAGGFWGGLVLCDTCSMDIMNYIIITKRSHRSGQYRYLAGKGGGLVLLHRD